MSLYGGTHAAWCHKLPGQFIQVRVVLTPFAPRTDSYSLFPVDGALTIPVKFLLINVNSLMQQCYNELTINLLKIKSMSCVVLFTWIYIIACDKSWRTAGIELGSLLETILRSERSPKSRVNKEMKRGNRIKVMQAINRPCSETFVKVAKYKLLFAKIKNLC